MGHHKRKIAIPGPYPKLKKEKSEISYDGQHRENDNSGKREQSKNVKTR